MLINTGKERFCWCI